MKKVFQVCYSYILDDNSSCWIFSDRIFMNEAEAEQYGKDLLLQLGGTNAVFEIVPRILVKKYVPKDFEQQQQKKTVSDQLQRGTSPAVYIKENVYN